MIKAITFDLWDTVIHDDSDEAKRASAGLPGKRQARRDLAWEAFNRAEPIARETVEGAYDVMEAAFNHVWHEQHVTWTVSERVAVLAKGLGRELPEPARGALVSALGQMEITVPPDPVPGIGDAIEALATHYPLAVVSDAIYTPGHSLRQWLDGQGLLGHFGAFAFSDEVGHSKPHRDMFATVAGALGVEVNEMLHIGDRDHNDVKGPHALGMKSVLFTATNARDRDTTTADAVCTRAADLAAVVTRVANGPA